MCGRVAGPVGGGPRGEAEDGRAAILAPDVPACRDARDRISRERAGRLKAASAGAHLAGRRGNHRSDEKKLQEAAELYGKAIEIAPELASAHYGRGRARLGQTVLGAGRKLVEADHTKAISLDPYRVNVLAARASVRRQRGDFKGAVDDRAAAPGDLEEVLRLRPGHREAPARAPSRPEPASRLCPCCNGTGVGKAYQSSTGVQIGSCSFCNGSGQIP